MEQIEKLAEMRALVCSKHFWRFGKQRGGYIVTVLLERPSGVSVIHCNGQSLNANSQMFIT